MNYFFSFRMIVAAIAIPVTALTTTVILSDDPAASMYVVPSATSVEIGGTLSVAVMVKSNVPVNAFTSELVFDTNRFYVTNISYNTSIANLWVEEPWYNRANNSIYFAGGTTQSDGFVGTGELMRVTLQARSAGDTILTLRNTRVLAHNGLGKDVSLVQPLDTLFSIDTTPFATPLQEIETDVIAIVSDLPPLDVNGDGVLSFRDIGTLLSALGSDQVLYDFNGDNKVTWADIRAWQKLRGLANE
jgi:hypothetical protein